MCDYYFMIEFLPFYCRENKITFHYHGAIELDYYLELIMAGNLHPKK